MVEDTRWEQRFSNYQRALKTLTDAVTLANQRSLSNLEQQGMIQGFEFTHELAWNVMKDYFVYQGNQSITGSRDAVRESFSKGLIAGGEGWMEMIKSRNLSSHTYNTDVAEQIIDKILTLYHPLFLAFEQRMQNLVSQ
ncbi:MAG: nucleotidyltransferase substrate binding protein [Thermodesulfobacteriota bacterium]|nr:nucleotidyltransferase substrate binding protein [Thermodesulfobacteriota bacterium]